MVTLDDVGGRGDEVVAPLFPTVMRMVDENIEVECMGVNLDD